MKKSCLIAVIATLAAIAGALAAVAVYLRRREKELDEYEPPRAPFLQPSQALTRQLPPKKGGTFGRSDMFFRPACGSHAATLCTMSGGCYIS